MTSTGITVSISSAPLERITNAFLLAIIERVGEWVSQQDSKYLSEDFYFVRKQSSLQEHTSTLQLRGRWEDKHNACMVELIK